MTKKKSATTARPEWSDELEKKLRKMWAENFSASQIAKDIGNGHTRNSVIGKAHRLGLDSRGPPPSRVTKVHVEKPKPPPEPEAEAQPFYQRYSSEPLPGSKPMLIWHLENCHCRWPLHGTGEHTWFCGTPAADLTAGKPYCPAHAVRAFG